MDVHEINVNEEILRFIHEAGFFFYATTENGFPKVRPLGYIEEIKGKLIVALSTTKAMAKQTLANPYYEACASTQGRWIRFSGKAVPVTDPEVIAKVLECPILSKCTPETVGAFELGISNAEYFTLHGDYALWK